MAKRRAENAWFCDPMGWTAGVIAFIGLFAVFAWQSWLGTFQSFFFEPGSWLFSYTDTLIRLFPIKFWFGATLTISRLGFADGMLPSQEAQEGRLAVTFCGTHNITGYPPRGAGLFFSFLGTGSFTCLL